IHPPNRVEKKRSAQERICREATSVTQDPVERVWLPGIGPRNGEQAQRRKRRSRHCGPVETSLSIQAVWVYLALSEPRVIQPVSNPPLSRLRRCRCKVFRRK